MVLEIPAQAMTTTGFTDVSALPGLNSLWTESIGDPRVCVAVLDGPVDQSHPCFDAANLTRLPTLVSDVAGSGLLSGHGTHITSVIFGQHSSPVRGIAPGCRGLIVPVFSDNRSGPLSQMDLARAINQAVEQGAHIINISGGQLSQSGEADPMLVNAVRFCNDEGVLIVAAAGNDACQCLHVPAALPSVLAVGAMNAQGLPFDFSNWGEVYQTQGILAPGENILGAEPGGGVSPRSGTSFATPVVSGIVALLVSIQILRGEKPNPHAVGDAILKSALPCNQQEVSDCRRFLGGRLNIPGAHDLIAEGRTKEESGENPEVTTIQPSEAKNIGQEITDQTNEIEQLQPSEGVNLSSLEESTNLPPAVGVFAASATTSESTAKTIHNSENPMTVTSSNVVASSSVTPSNVVPSGNCGCDAGGITASVTPSNAPGNPEGSLIYALGVIGYDFGTEARRDSFKQLMPSIDLPDAPRIPANPYDARQMKDYLATNLSEASSLIWTLNLELTPIYAIEPKGSFGHTVYGYLREFLEGQVQAEDSDDFVERVSIPGVLTGRTVRLFSGQVVPVIEPVNVRGMYSWTINPLIDSAVAAVQEYNQREQLPPLTPAQLDEIRYSLRVFLQRIYYDLRNLGQTSQERALNFAATDVFQNVGALVEVLRNKKRPSADTGSGQAVTMQLDTLEVERSPFCRMDSDCWDVKLKFFDPENDQRAKRVIRYTIDVSDIMPVTLGKARIWDVSN